jgi:hypothetical protein
MTGTVHRFFLVGGLAFITTGVFQSISAAPQRVYTITRNDDKLHEIGATNAATKSTVILTLAGEAILGGNGLALDPTTGDLFGILKLQGQEGRELVTIDPATGICTSVGDLGDRFAAIAFDSAGTLYGVTGDGALISETLYEISTRNARITLITALGNGDDGEALTFNPDDGLLYHLSGTTQQIFETINPSTVAITNIPLSGETFIEGLGLGYQGSGVFLMSDWEGNLLQVTTAGVVSPIGPLDHFAKGIAFIPSVAECAVDSDCEDGFFCTGIETCFDGICQPGLDPCPGQFCDDGIDECGCLVNADCDDGDPCTIDTCVPGTCFNNPVPDTDLDGFCDFIDNCPDFWNPTQAPALFQHTVLALSETIFGWGVTVPTRIVRGPFVNVGDIGNFNIDADVTGITDNVIDSTMPLVGQGLWYLMRPDCASASWSTGSPSEVPGRDTSLP